MKYISTRDPSIQLTASQAILKGISPEGGLFVPEEFPQVDLDFIRELEGLTYWKRAERIMALYLDDFSREDLVVVSPDLGSVTRARKFTQKLDMPLAIIDKRRPKANVSEVMNIIGNVEGKKCILVDDLIDTAGTLVHAADALVERGGATEVYACASHGVLSGPAIERIQNSPIKELTILDTIPLTNDKKLDKINVLPVAPVFTEAIARIYEETSVSTLFD